MKQSSKISIYAILFLMACTIQLSCKKDNTSQATATAFPIQGLWVGTYSVDGDPGAGQQYFSFIVKPDGTLVCDTKGNGNTKQYIGIGTWTLAGNTLSTTVINIYGNNGVAIGINQTSTSTWDNTGKLTNGIWKNPSPSSGQGTFTLNRIN
jgi:hypothetical protein